MAQLTYPSVHKMVMEFLVTEEDIDPNDIVELSINWHDGWGEWWWLVLFREGPHRMNINGSVRDGAVVIGDSSDG